MSDNRNSRGSLFTGILLILFGFLLLSRRFFPDLAIGHILVRWWPVLLIIWGLALLMEQVAARKAGRPSPGLRGVDLLLVILLIFVVTSVIAWDQFRGHLSDWGVSSNWMRESATSSEELPAVTVQPGEEIQVTIPAGDITVHTSDDNMLHVVAKRMAYAWDKSEAERQAQRVEVVLNHQSGGYKVQPGSGFQGSDARVDLDIQAPAEMKIAAQTGSGDINISDMKGGVNLTSSNGDTEIHDITGDVTIQSRHGDTEISGVHGNVRVEGEGGDVEIADVTGSATLQGEFYGTIRVRNVPGGVTFTSSRTNLTIGGLTGHVEIDSGSLEIADVTGAVKVSTREKDVTLENVDGEIDLSDKHGDVEVRLSQALHSSIRLVNDTGDVSLSLPSSPNFSIDASSRSGQIESDFQAPSLNVTNENSNSHLGGSYGNGGPHIHIETSYGTISLHQAS
jgi:hypothetical protein